MKEKGESSVAISFNLQSRLTLGPDQTFAKRQFATQLTHPDFTAVIQTYAPLGPHSLGYWNWEWRVDLAVYKQQLFLRHPRKPLGQNELENLIKLSHGPINLR